MVYRLVPFVGAPLVVVAEEPAPSGSSIVDTLYLRVETTDSFIQEDASQFKLGSTEENVSKLHSPVFVRIQRGK